ncbi:MAG TPA: Holliday junction branch migration protein RuvA [Clostridiaceae bacterium]|nr:Holliday junction branch migration protein RuvA [Clostridiaceae bacterium]
MFAYIKGMLDYKGTDSIVVEANGVGYRIYTPFSTLEKIGQVRETVKVFTHLHVREDAMTIYGFLTQEELEMFELLISVSGVGPKAALSLISTVSPSRFGLAVITGDANTIVKAQGIGKKIAQRIILELKDKIKKEQLESFDSDTDTSSIPAEGDSARSEAVSALMVLGYNHAEARKAVSSVYSEEMDVELIIKKALQVISK